LNRDFTNIKLSNDNKKKLRQQRLQAKRDGASEEEMQSLKKETA
jgi:hypothetical protein